MWTFLGRIMVVALALLCLAPAEAQPGTLPLLDRRLATGVIYSEVADPARVQTDRAWESLRRSGATAYELAYPWDQLEGSDGDYDFGGLLALLDTLELAGMDTYLALTTVDTSVLRLPGRFLDPNDSGALRADLAFDSPEIVDALALLMLELAPELVERGCFYVSVGNEVDVWLSAHPDQEFPFAVFAETARVATHIVEPDIAVGVTMTREALANPPLVQLMASVSDAPALTYYPMEDNAVLPTEIIGAELDAFEALIGGKQYLIQEAGCPAGWPGGVIAASPALQRSWIRAVFREARARPRVRFVSWLHLADWSDQQLDEFEAYYGASSPAFREFLGTLGVMTSEGLPKPALRELVGQIRLSSKFEAALLAP
ncbi:MAG: hypothetical protein KC561_15940 [Myxococcales bacterium]|nr:hypothetical protein [Myxococcales bacterium]